MPKLATNSSLSRARESLAHPISFESFLEKLSPKDRVQIERHVAALDAEGEPRHAQIWRRLAASLLTLAESGAKVNRQQSLQFYAPDGKYRMQVFAMEDLRDGTISVICGDAADEAVSAGLLVRRSPRGTAPAAPVPAPETYLVRESGDPLVLERLDGRADHPAFFKDMLGWNRRAVRIRVPVNASKAQVSAVELLCALSLERAGRPRTAAAE